MSAEIVTKSPELEEPTSVTHHDSEEYESAEEVEEVSYEEGELEEVEVEVEVEEEVEDEEEATEQPDKEKEVDEDRKNPQFIPKKGYYYEHDDRGVGGEEGNEAEVNEVKVEKPKPKVVNRDPDRWTHDLFDEEEQAPKTRTELSGRYGYDIRSEDQAPRARRRRRYGRGPTKYTRKWEEEEAYQKPRGGFRGRGGRRSSGSARQGTRAEFEEEFPELGSTQSRGKPPPETAIATAETEKKESHKENYYQTPSKGDNERGGGGGGRRGGSGTSNTRGRGSDREKSDDNRGRGGGVSGVGPARGWGRRNEFSNRNRYPDRRGSGSEKDYAAAASGGRKEENVERPKEHYYQQKESPKADDVKKTTEKVTVSDRNFSNTTNQAVSSTGKKPITGRNPPPFTNTEYRGSESLAAVTSQNANDRMMSSRSGQNERNYNEDVSNVGRESFQREGDEHDRRSNRGYPPDRRAQMPPRLQQQQQPLESAPKPKRFSTQRQRQNVEQTKALNTASGTGGPVPSSGVGPGGPSSAPVSGISSYPQTQGFYDTVPSTYEGRVYPGPASSVAVSGSHGPTVTPSLWVPHSSPYVTAPYPSPPTGPQVPQPPYQDPATFMQAQQPGPPIFAPPPHPQFIQDPTIINYVPPVPPPNYGPSFHASGFQGYAQVAPPPPPELYHGGVTYYSTQNQMPRPHIPAMNKRPKQVLQLVEPPEKKDIARYYPGGVGQHGYDMDYGNYHEGAPLRQEPESGPPPSSTPVTSTTGAKGPKPNETELGEQFESMKLQPESERVKKSPSPAPLDLGTKSWSEQVADDMTPVNSPTDTQERIFTSDKPNDENKNGTVESNSENVKETKSNTDEGPSSSPK